MNYFITLFYLYIKKFKIRLFKYLKIKLLITLNLMLYIK